MQTGITRRISVGSAGEGDSHSFYPSIRADGRAVVFTSYADNLVSGFNVHNFGDIYLYFNPQAVADGIFIPGDFNQDDAVDAADYVWLRKNASNQSQYDVWRANFGAIVGSGAVSGTDNPILGQGSTTSENASAQVTENVLSNESQPISQTPSRAVDGPLDFEFAYSAPFESLFGIRPQRIAMQVARSAVARHDDGLLAWLSSQSLPNSDNTLDDDFFGAIHCNGDQSSEFRFDTIESALDKLLVGDPKSW